MINTPESTLLVLSDGLGSGVKANILSTLTSKIISTMISRGASIEDTVDTIAHTLPVCKLRGIAYSTFMILHICKDGKGYIVEYDNPPCMLIRDGRHIPFDYEEKTIEGKLVRESRFTAKPGDYFVIVSDGVTQAGMGETLAFGWGCDEGRGIPLRPVRREALRAARNRARARRREGPCTSASRATTRPSR